MALLVDELFTCVAEEPDLDEDELLEGVLTDLEEDVDLDGAEPEDTFVLLPEFDGCSILLLA